jgi:uncharacterized protein (DUF433 family)
MSQMKEYVTIDADGAMYVGEARVPMEAIMVAYGAGDSPESILSQYDGLTLEEVYGAITFYLANPKLVDEYLQRQEALWNEWKAKLDANPAPVVLRLRALKAQGAKVK